MTQVKKINLALLELYNTALELLKCKLIKPTHAQGHTG